MTPFVREASEGIEIDLLVQPRASRSRVVGLHDGRLKVQLAAPPVDGEANAALLEFLAGLLGVPKRQVRIARGETSRRKTITIQGLEAGPALAALGGPLP